MRNFQRLNKTNQFLFLIIATLCLCSCNNNQKTKEDSLIEIGFIDAFEDATLAKARNGFVDALQQNGFKNDSNIHIKFLNAQGDISMLTQACQSMLSGNVKFIATNSTMATIAAVKQTKDVPIFMMVAPRPDIAGLTKADGKSPANLFGVYETLFYIDSSISIIHQLKPDVKKLGLIYNQAETQSQDALEVVKKACANNNIALLSLPVNSSADSKIVTEALLSKGIDVFFALPDNVIFSSFETIAKSCEKSNVPIFTSEAGLVSRGAVASYGADFYHWGFQSGEQAANFLKSNSTKNLQPEEVKLRIRVINKQKAEQYGIIIPAGFEVIDTVSK